MADSEEGADQVEVEVMDEVAGEEEEAEEGGNMGMVIGIVVVVLLVVVVAAVGGYFLCNDSGSKCKKSGTEDCTKADLVNKEEEPGKSMDDKLKGDEFCAKLTEAQCVPATFTGEKDCCKVDAPPAAGTGS